MLWLHSSTGRNLAVAATRLNMAQAERVIEKVPVTTYEDKVTVKLTLTAEEARALQLFLGRGLGDPGTTFRRYTDDIFNALVDSGIGARTSAGVVGFLAPALTPEAIRYIEGE